MPGGGAALAADRPEFGSSFATAAYGNMMSITLSEEDLEEIKLFVPDISVHHLRQRQKIGARRQFGGGNRLYHSGREAEYADISNCSGDL
jgi:hypothetical protein